MTTIYLIRHAEAEGNLYRRIHGHYNALITQNGYAQIRALERRFADIHVDEVWSSDLYRTMTTAQSICRPKNLPLNTDPDLREIYFGQWEDVTWGEKGHFESEQLRCFNRSVPDWAAPGGETRLQVGARVERAMRRIAVGNPQRTVAVFSHGTAIQQFTAAVLGLAPEQWNDMGHADNTAVTCVTWDGEKFHVEYQSDNSHLDESISTLAHQNWWRGGRDVNLWYRPIDGAQDRDLYADTRRCAGFCCEDAGVAVSVAMDRDQPVGFVQLDDECGACENVGYIPFCAIIPERWDHSLAIQLVGHAVAHFRPMGRDRLRLRCAHGGQLSACLCERYGFEKVGQERSGAFDVLEKYIGYDR